MTAGLGDCTGEKLKIGLIERTRPALKADGPAHLGQTGRRTRRSYVIVCYSSASMSSRTRVFVC